MSLNLPTGGGGGGSDAYWTDHRAPGPIFEDYACTIPALFADVPDGATIVSKANFVRFHKEGGLVQLADTQDFWVRNGTNAALGAGDLVVITYGVISSIPQPVAQVAWTGLASGYLPEGLPLAVVADPATNSVSDPDYVNFSDTQVRVVTRGARVTVQTTGVGVPNERLYLKMDGTFVTERPVGQPYYFIGTVISGPVSGGTCSVIFTPEFFEAGGVTTSLKAVGYGTGAKTDSRADHPGNAAFAVELSDGRFVSSGPVYFKNHGYTIGTVYHLSQTVAGAFVAGQPTGGGMAGFIQPCFTPMDADTLNVHVGDWRYADGALDGGLWNGGIDIEMRRWNGTGWVAPNAALNTTLAEVVQFSQGNRVRHGLVRWRDNHTFPVGATLYSVGNLGFIGVAPIAGEIAHEIGKVLDQRTIAFDVSHPFSALPSVMHRRATNALVNVVTNANIPLGTLVFSSGPDVIYTTGGVFTLKAGNTYELFGDPVWAVNSSFVQCGFVDVATGAELGTRGHLETQANTVSGSGVAYAVVQAVTDRNVAFRVLRQGGANVVGLGDAGIANARPSVTIKTLATKSAMQLQLSNFADVNPAALAGPVQGARLVYLDGQWQNDTLESVTNADVWWVTPWGWAFRMAGGNQQFEMRNDTGTTQHVSGVRYYWVANGATTGGGLVSRPNWAAGAAEAVWGDNTLNLASHGSSEQFIFRWAPTQDAWAAGNYREMEFFGVLGAGYNNNHLRARIIK